MAGNLLTDLKPALDEPIRELNLRGAACASSQTVRQLLDDFVEHKEKSDGIEASTANYYRKDARTICRYIGDVRLALVRLER